MKKHPLLKALMIPIIAITVLSLYLARGIWSTHAPTSVPAISKTTAYLQTHRITESPAPPARKHQIRLNNPSGKSTTPHPVTIRSQSDEHAFILTTDPDEAQASIVKSLGARVTASKAGRTGQVIRIKSSDAVATKKQLIASGIDLSAQLIELSMASNHKHEHCGSCLMENYAKISQIDGVLNIPRYLGDAKTSEIDITINPEKISTAEILTVLNSNTPRPPSP